MLSLLQETQNLQKKYFISDHSETRIYSTTFQMEVHTSFIHFRTQGRQANIIDHLTLFDRLRSLSPCLKEITFYKSQDEHCIKVDEKFSQILAKNLGDLNIPHEICTPMTSFFATNLPLMNHISF